MIVLACRFDDIEGHTPHEFPDDWEFGGARNQDPRSDARWRATQYEYLDDHFNVVWTTVTPLCDDEAIDEFTKHAILGVKYLQVRRPGEDKFTLLDWQYQADDDLVVALGA